jgi:hypothetical protein
MARRERATWAGLKRYLESSPQAAGAGEQPGPAPRQIILRREEAVVALYVHLAADRHRLV